jgi:hypothetical protein
MNAETQNGEIVGGAGSSPSLNAGEKWCRCKRAPRLPGKRICAICHRETNNKSNACRAKRLFAIEHRLDQLTNAFLDNPATKASFREKFSSAPYITIRNHKKYGSIRVIVVAFLPGDILLVQAEFAKSTRFFARLEEMERDDRGIDLRSPLPEPAAEITEMIFGSGLEPFLTPKPRKSRKAREVGGNSPVVTKPLNTHQNGKIPSYLPQH